MTNAILLNAAIKYAVFAQKNKPNPVRKKRKFKCKKY